MGNPGSSPGGEGRDPYSPGSGLDSGLHPGRAHRWAGGAPDRAWARSFRSARHAPGWRDRRRIGGWLAGEVFAETAGVDWIASILVAAVLVLLLRAGSHRRVTSGRW